MGCIFNVKKKDYLLAYRVASYGTAAGGGNGDLGPPLDPPEANLTP